MRVKTGGWLKSLETASFFAASAVFFILRVIYKKTDENLIAGIFGRVNDSVWEETKIVFFPYLLLSVLEFFAAGVRFKTYFAVKTRSLLLIMFAVPAFCFTYAGVAGISSVVIDTAGCLLVLGAAFVLSCRGLINHGGKSPGLFVWTPVLLAMLSLFLLFTVFAQPVNIFTDPVTGQYGLSGQSISASYNTLFT